MKSGHQPTVQTVPDQDSSQQPAPPAVPFDHAAVSIEKSPLLNSIARRQQEQTPARRSSTHLKGRRFEPYEEASARRRRRTFVVVGGCAVFMLGMLLLHLAHLEGRRERGNRVVAKRKSAFAPELPAPVPERARSGKDKALPDKGSPERPPTPAARKRGESPDLRPGLWAQYNKGKGLERVRDACVVSDLCSRQLWRNFKSQDHFDIRFTGVLRIARAGDHEFSIKAKDVAVFKLDGVTVKEKERVRLIVGDHDFHLFYGNRVGGGVLRLLWKPPGAAKFVPVPANAFWHDGATKKAPAAVPADP